MSYALHYREEITDPATVKELDDLAAYFNSFLKVSFDKTGALLPTALAPVDPAAPATGAGADELHHWKNGPWIFDTPSAHNAILVTPQLTGTVNDIAPQGIDTAIGIEFNLSGNLTITGIKAPVGAYRRILILRNNSGANTITLKHANTGSQSVNQFQLPGSVDIVMSTRQTVWLYYDADNHNWGCFITANTSGGLSGAGGPSTGDVVGPASATDGDIVLFNGATGKLVKDSGVTLASITAVTSAALLSVSVTINDSQIKSLNSAPVDLVAAQPGKLIVPVLLTMRKPASTNAYSGNPSISPRYSGIAADLCSSFGSSFGGTGFAYATGPQNGATASSDPLGIKVVLRSSADITSVGDTSGNSATFTMAYYVI